jgi:hypothetical protein
MHDALKHGFCSTRELMGQGPKTHFNSLLTGRIGKERATVVSLPLPSTVSPMAVIDQMQPLRAASVDDGKEVFGSRTWPRTGETRPVRYREQADVLPMSCSMRRQHPSSAPFASR